MGQSRTDDLAPLYCKYTVDTVSGTQDQLGLVEHVIMCEKGAEEPNSGKGGQKSSFPTHWSTQPMRHPDAICGQPKGLPRLSL